MKQISDKRCIHELIERDCVDCAGNEKTRRIAEMLAPKKKRHNLDKSYFVKTIKYAKIN